MTPPLSGIRIVDLTQMVAGASATQLLGDLGADVIKIEPPEGEVIRRSVAGPTFQGDHYMFLAYNRNKKSITLDLRTKTGKEVFNDLVRVSDVVYDNFRAGAVKRLGADYETLKEINPKIICASTSGYGGSGPYSNLPSVDITIQAESGIASITGEADGPPVKCGPAVVDIAAGIFGALAVVAALMTRERTGVGQRIDLSLLDVGIYLMAYQIGYYSCSGEVPGKLGGAHIASNPYGIYPAKDGYLAVGPCWPRIARLLEVEEIIDDPRFADREARLRNRRELDDILIPAFQKMGAREWVDILRAADISAGVVNNVAQAMSDPQVIHRNMILEVEHPRGGKVKLAANPIQLPEGLPQDRFTPPPLLGQHNDQVLTEVLGYAKEKIDELRAEEKAHAKRRVEHLEKSS